MSEATAISLKTFATRLFHMALALAVISQLLSSLAMEAPRRDRAGDLLFMVHEYSGLVTLALAIGFWLVIMTRRRGTAFGMLIPWFSVTRRAAFVADFQETYRAVRSLRLPEYKEESPLASAIHGLGVLLMTGMAGSGTIYFLADIYGARDALLPDVAIELHGLFANLVWAYLIGHALMALLHQLAGHARIRDMWSLKRN